MTDTIREQHRLLEEALCQLRGAAQRVIAHNQNLDNAVRKVDLWPSYHERAALAAARKQHRMAMTDLRKAQKVVTNICIDLPANKPEAVS